MNKTKQSLLHELADDLEAWSGDQRQCKQIILDSKTIGGSPTKAEGRNAVGWLIEEYNHQHCQERAVRSSSQLRTEDESAASKPRRSWEPSRNVRALRSLIEAISDCYYGRSTGAVAARRIRLEIVNTITKGG